MFFKIIGYLLIAIIALQASDQKVEILANTLDKIGTMIHAKDDVVLYSEKYIITADEAYYDHNSSDLELIGNITIMEGIDFSSRSGYAKLNLKNDSGKLTPMFGYSGESRLWVKCDTSTFDEKYYLFNKSITSSCDVKNPDWKIGFTSAEYNRESKFLHMYNTLFYAKDVPIFYLPYFAFPTDKERRSGLLRPDIGFGSSEGLYYLQPIYFAPQVNWDFQLNPQIRTNRGVGLHGKLRFVDSAYSAGQITLGKFKEKSKYAEENDLKNVNHYGYAIEYDRSKLFSGYIDDEAEDGLWLDFNYLNDIDYLNTMNKEDEDEDQLIQSTMNYYIKRDLDYFGLYAKYYIDTSKVSNDDTIQEIPTFHYHRFTNSILADNVFYSVDYKTTNLTSKTDLDAITHQVDAPITIYFPLLNDFLHFKASENVHIAKINYERGLKEDDGSVVENFHTLSLYTELAKAYDNFFHTIYFGVDYTIPGNNKKSDGFIRIENDTSLDEFDSFFLNRRENLSINLVEYFYNSNGRKIVSHSLKQSIILDDLAADEYRYQDLSNDVQFYFSKDLTLKNLLNYSHKNARFSKLQTSLNWTLEEYSLSFIHTYQKDEQNEIDNYLTFSVNTDFVKNYNLFASTNYDIEEDYFKSWQVGLIMKKKCWDYRLTYREERTPKLTSAGSDSTNKKGVYLMFNLYPIGGVQYGFTKETKTDTTE
ncbi:LPS-assembly protein LptD [Sulfurospirillum arcachonense]|uniref:LPS-assembly protein LptD n=1 Tax=Sulfurospirillum arcachonense TaxID=57666 RepID=UPI0004693944|nr:LPS-assembly protein LptD [Sulfurospirillum arcachonense]